MSSFGLGCIRGRSCSSRSSIASGVPSCIGTALHLRTCNHRPEDMDRVTRVRHRHCVFFVEHRQAEMRDSLLGTNCDNRLRLLIEVNGRTASCTSCRWPCGAAEFHATMNSDASRSSAPLRSACRQYASAWLRRIAHPEVDDVLTAFACGSLQLACDVEYIRRQPCQPSKFFHSLSASSCLSRFLNDATTHYQ